MKLATPLAHEGPADHTAHYNLAGPEQVGPPRRAQLAPALRENVKIRQYFLPISTGSTLFPHQFPPIPVIQF